jgi:hypothetical protein
VDDDVRADHAWAPLDALDVRFQHRDWDAGMCDHDLLAGADASDELAEQRPRIVGVVLSKAGPLPCLDQAAQTSLT